MSLVLLAIYPTTHPILFWSAYLMFVYFLNPRVLITAERLHVRNFWGVKRWALAEIVGIATKRERLKPRPGMRTSGVSVVIEWVVLELANGRSLHRPRHRGQRQATQPAL